MRIARAVSVLWVAGCGKVLVPTHDGGLGGFEDAAKDSGTFDGSSSDDALPSDARPDRVSLTIEIAGDGRGRVSSSEAAIDCAARCTVQIEAGSTVRLTATPDLGSTFGEWSEPSCGGATECDLVIGADSTIVARFLALYDVHVISEGSGLGRVDYDGRFCVGTCDSTYPSGTELTLRAVPAAGVRFGGWSGACSGASISCSLTVDGTKEVRPRWDVILPQVSAQGGGHFCALLGPRSVRCWGNGSLGQLGWQNNQNVGDDETVASMGDLPLGLDVVQLVAGGTHTCVLQKSGSVRCWGANDYGQLGQGNTDFVGNQGGAAPANIPDVDLGGPALQIAMGGWHVCALMAEGTVRCWGRGAEGQLGYGSSENVADGTTPITSPALAGDVNVGGVVVGIGVGNAHSCAVLEAGELKCWGTNSSGQLGHAFDGNVGDGNPLRPEPVDVPALPLGQDPVVEVDGGLTNTCARFASGKVRCWGSNASGEAGTGDFLQVGGSTGRPLASSNDVDLGGISAVQIAAGAGHACARLVTGALRCWGEGDFGVTGYEGIDDLATPPGDVEIGPQRSSTWIGLSGLGTCATASEGSAVLFLCWGFGLHGGLGNGDTANLGDTAGSMPPPLAPIQ